jgi:2-isopropylmalate synthase
MRKLGDLVYLYDTTLRDGTQGEGISLTLEDKLKITAKLDELGVHYIEGGWPGSNPKDLDYFKRVKELSLKQAKVSAFGSTRMSGITVDDDPNIRALLEADTPVVTIFGKSWDFHVTKALNTTLEENINMIWESVQYLKAQKREVVYDAEHFFDGYKANPDYALATLKAASNAGADWIVLCDTNGGALPGEIEEVLEQLGEEIDTPLGIHVHNDGELAVANSLAAVKAGARQVQGTINGFGERCGNANICSVLPNLQLKMGMRCLSSESLKRLTEVCSSWARCSNNHTGFTCSASITISCMGSSLLMPHQYMLQGRVIQLIIERYNSSPRIAKNNLNPFLFQRFDNNFCTCYHGFFLLPLYSCLSTAPLLAELTS